MKALENRGKSLVDKMKLKNRNTDGDHSLKLKRETRTLLHIREDMSINSIGQNGKPEATESSGQQADDHENQNNIEGN